MGKSIISCSALWICTTIIGLLYYAERARYLYRAQDELTTIARHRRHQINDYFSKHEKNISAIGYNAELIAALQKLTELDKKNQLTSDSAEEIKKNLRKLFQHIPEAAEYDHLFLVSVKGSPLFSLKPKLQYEVPEQNSNQENTLSQSFGRIVMSLAPDVFYTSYYPPTQRSALFISVPIFAKQALIGILCVQLNDLQLFELATNSAGLGKTGESVLGKKEGQDVIYVSKVRHRMRAQTASTGAVIEQVQGRKVPIGKWSEALGQAVLGNTQFLGITLDYRGRQVVAVGSYLPHPDWGMVTKKDLTEIFEPLLLLKLCFYALVWASIIALIALLLLLLNQYLFFNRSLLAMGLSFIISLVLLGYLVYRYRTLNSFVIDRAVSSSEMQINNAIFSIDQKLNQVKHVAHAIAAELARNHFSREDLRVRIKRDLSENPDFVAVTVAFDPKTRGDQKLFAPIAVRKDGTIEMTQLEKFYDYTIVYPKETTRSSWYLQTLNTAPTITEIYRDPITNKQTVVYAVPFTTKKQRGVVAIMYNLESIQNSVKNISIGKGSHAVLFNTAHELLYYPLSGSVGKTIEAVAQKSFTQELRVLLTRVAQNRQGVYQYYSKTERLETWLLYQPVRSVPWTVAVLFNEDDILFPVKEIFNYQLFIVLCMLLVAVCLGILVLYHEHFALYMYSLLISGIFAGGLVMLWILIDRNLAKSPNQLASISDRVSLNEFIKTVNQEALLAHKRIPETLKTGIFVDYLQLTKSFNILLVGRVWQKVPLKLKDRLPAGIKFPQALNATIKELYRKTENDYEIVSWSVKCEIFQTVDYTKYPFDLTNLNIQLEYPDVTKNVLLVPDLEYYPTLVPQLLPGLSPTFQVSGFVVIQSFFNYEYVEKKVVVDRNRETQTKQPIMTFNIILRRGLINTLIMYLLPLFIILVSVFAVLWMVEGMPPEERAKSAVRFRFLSIFTAIFFALILLHRNLRGEFQSGEIGYIDYFFFFTYFTILVMMLYIIMRPKAIELHMLGSRSSAIQLLYWPVEFLFWIAVTVVVFYNY